MIEDALAAHSAVQLCAAVGAPDAYAGELPVAFVTLRPGASATEAELMAFAALRVDETPARPKSVTIIDTMPMTNVGKIYKPDLRLLAARAVVAALVEEICAADGGRDRPAIELDAQRQTVVVALAAAASEGELPERLRIALERVPFKTELRGTGGS